jgi:DNA-binding NarL/FixJ family response regulator
MQTYRDYAEARRLRGRRGDPARAAALELQANAICAQLGIAPSPSGSSNGGNRFGVTGRELEVLRLVARGRRNAEIAAALTISPRTVDRHLENILGKLDARTRTEAVVRAAEEGLVDEAGADREDQGPRPEAVVSFSA